VFLICNDVNTMSEPNDSWDDDDWEAYGEELQESYDNAFPPEPHEDDWMEDEDGDVYDGPDLR